jgi:ribosome-associated toxin RatA of RatAB toxin-antitoxin module
VEWGRAEGVVNAKLDDVVTILHDYSGYAALFPYFQKSKVLSQRGADALVYLEAKILHGATTLWGQVRISSKQLADQTRVVEAKLMKGKGNMSQLLARWEVTPVNGGSHTKVVFQLLVDPDLPVPDMVISHEMKNGAGQAFRALRRKVGERAALVSRPTSTL